MNNQMFMNQNMKRRFYSCVFSPKKVKFEDIYYENMLKCLLSRKFSI